MKKVLLICLAVSSMLTASAQRGIWGHNNHKDEPTVYIISVRESDTIWSNNPAYAQHAAAAKSQAAKAAVADHRAAQRTGFQQTDDANVAFANQKNSFSFAIGGFVAMRASYSFDDAVDNIDVQWEYMTQQEKQALIRTLVNKVVITGENVKIELTI